MILSTAWLSWWLPGAVLLVPLVTLPGAPDPEFWKAQAWTVWFGVGGALACLTDFPRKIRNDPLYLPFVLVLAAAVASSALAFRKGPAFEETLRLASLVAVVAVVGTSLPGDRLSRRTRRAALAAGAIVAATVLAEYAGVFRGSGPGRLVGLFGAHDRIGAFLAPLAVLAAPEIRRADGPRPLRLAIGAFGLVVWAAFLTFSRAAWIGLVVSLLVWRLVVHRRPRYRPEGERTAAAVGFAAVLVLSPVALAVAGAAPPGVGAAVERHLAGLSAKGNLPRIAFWDASIRMALDSPLLGVGPGNWPVYWPRFRRDVAEDSGVAHGDPLHLLGEYGLVGAGFLAWAVWVFLQGQWRQLRRGPGDEEATVWSAALAAVAADSLTSYPFHQTAPSVLAAVAMGIAHGRARETAGEYPSVPPANVPLRASLAVVVLAVSLGLAGWRSAAHLRYAAALRALEAGRPAEAVEAAAAAARIDPTEAAHWNVLGVAAHRAGEADRSIEAFRRESSLAPYDHSVQRNLAVVALAAGRVAEALEAARRMAALDPFAEAREAARRTLAAPDTAEGARGLVERVLVDTETVRLER